MKQFRLVAVLLLAGCLVLAAMRPGLAQGRLLAALLLNGDFEGSFYPYGSGYVAQSWIPYDYSIGSSPPQFLRSTLYKKDGQASQQIWSDRMSWYAGILQTTLLSSPSGVRIQAGKKYTVHVWTYSIYAGASSAVQNDKILKRVGIHPGGGADPKSSVVIWTPWHGQDKVWVQINAAAEATGDRLTVFIEAKNETAGGQDQLYIDGVSLEEEGAPTPTRTRTNTPTPTRTPRPTATPAIAVVRSVPVGSRPRGVAVLPHVNRFFVADNNDNTVSMLEGFFDWHHTSLPSGGQGASYLAVNPDECRLYVANTTSNNVTVFNACTNRQVGSVDLGGLQAPEGIAVLTTTNTVYVANSAAGTVAVIPGDTLVVGPRIATGPRPGPIAANPHTNKVYVANRGNLPTTPGTVTVINGNTQSVQKTIDFTTVDPTAEPYGVAVNPTTKRVYVTLASGKLVVIDGQSDTILQSVPAPVSTGLDAVAVNPASNNVFVSSTTGNQVFMYDADVGLWTYKLTVGAGWPRGIAINPLTYQVLVSNPSENTVSIIRDFGLYHPFRVLLPITYRP